MAHDHDLSPAVKATLDRINGDKKNSTRARERQREDDFLPKPVMLTSTAASVSFARPPPTEPRAMRNALSSTSSSSRRKRKRAKLKGKRDSCVSEQSYLDAKGSPGLPTRDAGSGVRSTGVSYSPVTSRTRLSHRRSKSCLKDAPKSPFKSQTLRGNRGSEREPAIRWVETVRIMTFDDDTDGYAFAPLCRPSFAFLPFEFPTSNPSRVRDNITERSSTTDGIPAQIPKNPAKFVTGDESVFAEEDARSRAICLSRALFIEDLAERPSRRATRGTPMRLSAANRVELRTLVGKEDAETHESFWKDSYKDDFATLAQKDGWEWFRGTK